MSLSESLNERLKDIPVLKRLANVKTVSNEVPKEVYLASLSSVDQLHIGNYIDFLTQRRNHFQDLTVGVIAFGSSVKPESERYHAVGDIDLRILTSAAPYSVAQNTAIGAAAGLTEQFLTRNAYDFGYDESCTTQSRVVPVSSLDPKTGLSKTETGPFLLDYDNNDPSFRAKPKEGLILHISITGLGEELLDIHIKEERRQKQYFSILGLF